MSNPYYNHSSAQPITGSAGASANMRAEFDAITAAFNLLPVIGGGTAGWVAMVNPAGTALVALNYLTFDGSGNATFLNGLAVSGPYVNAAAATAVNFGAATLTVANLAVTGTVTISGGTISGPVTFTTSPLVPTASPGDSSLNAASTAFVAALAFSSALPAISGATAGMVVSNNGTTGAWVPPIANDWILQAQGLI